MSCPIDQNPLPASLRMRFFSIGVTLFELYISSSTKHTLKLFPLWVRGSECKQLLTTMGYRYMLRLVGLGVLYWVACFNMCLATLFVEEERFFLFEVKGWIMPTRGRLVSVVGDE